MRLATALLLSASLLPAGQFRYGFAGARSDMAKLRVPKPPVFFIGKRPVSVEVVVPQSTGVQAGGLGQSTLTGVASATPMPPPQQAGTDPSLQQMPAAARILSELAAPDLGAIRVAAEEILAPAFTIVQQSPERIIRLNISGFDPVRTSQSTIQQTVPDPANPQQQVQVPVDMWEGSGRLSLRIEIIDPATNKVVDGLVQNAEFRRRGAIAVAGQQRVDPASLPIAEAIWKGLVRDVVNPLRERYTTVIEPVEFNLAADEELRPGNELAKNNYWKEALEKWQAATIKKPENEGDKVFNLGAAHEALAYEALLAKGPVEARPLFEKARQLYREAARLDPKERYISSGVERLERTAVYLNRAIQHHNGIAAETQQQQQQQQQIAAQQAAETAARTAAAQAEESKRREFAVPRADTIPEASFRKLVKVRLRAINAAPVSPDEQQKLQAMGQQVYKLQPLEAERVVYQESASWSEVHPKIQQYKETYAALFADKRIAPDEREVLKQLAEALGLAPDEVAATEGQFQ